MAKKDKSQNKERPAIEEFFEQKAAHVRDSAANAMLLQKLPDVPKLPAFTSGINGALSWLEGLAPLRRT